MSLLPNITKSARRNAAMTLLAVLGATAAAAAAPGKPDFSLGASPATQPVAAGAEFSKTFTVTVNRSNGFTGPLDLSVVDLPAFAAAKFAGGATTARVAAGSSSTSLTVSGTAPRSDATSANGNYTFAVAAAGSVGTRRATLTLNVIRTSGFQISGDVPERLSPGGRAHPLDLLITNPTNSELVVSGVEVTVAGTSVAACATGNFAVAQMPATTTVTVPANAGARLSELGATALPALRMRETHANQDDCRGAAVTLSYAATGAKR